MVARSAVVGEYRTRETVRIGHRRGLVIEQAAAGRRRRHTVLLGVAFEEDAVGPRAQPPVAPAVLARTDSDSSRGLGPGRAFQRAAVRDVFVLNARGRVDTAADPGNADDAASEMFGTTPVACTCDDWKWRGVRHTLARGPVGRISTKNSRLDRFYLDFRHNPRPRHVNTEDDNGLAARGGCRHMAWVRDHWRPPRRVGRVPRARRAPERYMHNT